MTTREASVSFICRSHHDVIFGEKDLVRTLQTAIKEQTTLPNLLLAELGEAVRETLQAWVPRLRREFCEHLKRRTL